jgi:hypothetical protein
MSSLARSLALPFVRLQDATLSEGSTEKLVAMVNDTAAKLNTIWDEVGFSAAERDVQITVLLQEVQRLFEEKVLPRILLMQTVLPFDKLLHP